MKEWLSLRQEKAGEGIKESLKTLLLALMRSANPIKAYSTLFVMLLAVMHNAFPHVHHQHDHSSELVVEDEFHHHDHHADHHHHSGEDEQDHGPNTFLDLLFKNHSHSKHFHDYGPVAIEHVTSSKQLDHKVIGDGSIWILDVRRTADGPYQYIRFENPVAYSSHLPSHPYRGPPSLG